MILILLLTTFLTYQVFSEPVKFNNYSLYSVRLKQNETIANELIKLRQTISIDFWQDPSRFVDKINLVVGPKHQTQLEQHLNDSKVEFNLITGDLQEWIERERVENNLTDDESLLAGRYDVSSFQVNTYHSWDEIKYFLEKVSEQYSQIATLDDVGSTYEGRQIKAIKLGVPTGNQKPIFWIDGGIHAREWVSPATVLYIIHYLVTNYQKDPQITELLQRYDWYLIPVINADGYVYTWTTNRLWRKNRAPSRSSGSNNPWSSPWSGFRDCKGTDLNRNFDVDFGGSSTSRDPCQETFCGDHAFSERETQAIRNKILSFNRNMRAFVSLHSYSQMWMIPYGYKNSLSKHHNNLNQVLSQVADAVRIKHGTHYRHGTIAKTIYLAAGSSVDWVHEKADVKYSFVVELRDLGERGFLLPNSQIIPTAEETWEGIKVIANAADKN